MKHRTLRNLLSFVLVLALTIGAVATLSMATQAKTETASTRYSQEVREEKSEEVTELTAAIPEEETSPLLSIGGFALILAIPAAGVLLFVKARRKGRDFTEQAGRRYSPRADMAFQGTASIRTRA